MTNLTNIPELTVSELALSLKRTLEDTYARVRVRGELSKVKIHSSGHLYSDLKDADSVLNIICWRGTLSKLSLHPEEGLDVICTGRITSYPARSNYQMVVEQMELAGEGALLKMLEDRKKRLAAEGLFDESRKQSFPYLPQKIGVITSPTGAVIRDILHRLSDRFPLPVLLWGVKVQGDGAAQEIASAIDGMNALPKDQRPDVLIVARGGGSLEDLMAFNEEIVVRAVVRSRIPIISAVGHETDTTLIDYAADRRAPTPTAAAEFAVPERIAIMSFVNGCTERLTQALQQQVTQRKTMVQHIAARISTPERLLETRLQRLDMLDTKIRHNIDKHLQTAQQSLLKISSRLLHPESIIRANEYKIEMMGVRLKTLTASVMQQNITKLDNFVKLLDVLSFKSVLGRGFALVRDENGRPITSIAGIRHSQPIQIDLKDGIIHSVVEKTKETG